MKLSDMKLAQWFVTGKRDDGESFVSLKDGRPDWLQEAVHEAHVDAMPDDWVYAECEGACYAIDDGRVEDEDGLHQHADSRVDTYTKDRFRWATDMCLTSLYGEAEELAKEISAEDDDIATRIGVIQYHAILNIAAVMLNAAKEASEQDEDEDEDKAEAE